MRHWFSLLSFMLLLSACVNAKAAQRGVAVYFDQDLLLPVVNEDRDYTMGVGIEFFEEEGGLYPLDTFLGRVGSMIGLDPNASMRRSYLLGSVNYTPDNLAATAPVTSDRPYASVLFLANKRVLADRHTAIGVEAQAGLLGTYLAREAQRRIHKALREARNSEEPVDPQGWGNQISAGGEPTFRLRLARSELIAEAPGLWDFSGTGTVSLGYQTNASLGLALRTGLLQSPFWSLPYDPINRGNFVPAFGQEEIYLWAAGRARAVAYDALLQGQFRDSAHTIPAEDIEPLVFDGGIGVTASWEALQLTVSANLKTSEVARGDADRNQWWGGLYLSVRY